MEDSAPNLTKLAKLDFKSVRRSSQQRILNVCGTCTECCRVLAVNDLPQPKPEVTTCVHQCATGCRIYKRRPPSCQGYTCVYHTWMHDGEAVPLALRPDKSHVIIDYMPHMKCHYVRVDSLYERAWQKPPVINTIVSMLLKPDVEMVLMVDGLPKGKFRKEAFQAMITSMRSKGEKRGMIPIEDAAKILMPDHQNDT